MRTPPEVLVVLPVFGSMNSGVGTVAVRTTTEEAASVEVDGEVAREAVLDAETGLAAEVVIRVGVRRAGERADVVAVVVGDVGDAPTEATEDVHLGAAARIQEEQAAQREGRLVAGVVVVVTADGEVRTRLDTEPRHGLVAETGTEPAEACAAGVTTADERTLEVEVQTPLVLREHDLATDVVGAVVGRRRHHRAHDDDGRRRGLIDDDGRLHRGVDRRLDDDRRRLDLNLPGRRKLLELGRGAPANLNLCATEPRYLGVGAEPASRRTIGSLLGGCNRRHGHHETKRGD